MADIGLVSDGYHTFNELYDHRAALMIALMSVTPNSWWATEHFDGSMFSDSVICGINLPNGMVTYHIAKKYSEDLAAAGIKKLDKAPEWDGHTSEDVFKRLLAFSRIG